MVRSVACKLIDQLASSMYVYVLSLLISCTDRFRPLGFCFVMRRQSFFVDANYITAAPIKSRKADDLVHGFEQCYSELTRNGFTAKLIRLDNEISKKFVAKLETAELQYQLASPGDHRVNPAERSIQTWKNHFISTLSGTDDEYPDDCWDLLVPQTNITANLLRAARIQPKISAYAQAHGNFDFNATPMAPAGCKVIIHDRPSERGTCTTSSCASSLLNCCSHCPVGSSSICKYRIGASTPTDSNSILLDSW